MLTIESMMLVSLIVSKKAKNERKIEEWNFGARNGP